jgi:hypothetical protein
VRDDRREDVQAAGAGAGDGLRIDVDPPRILESVAPKRLVDSIEASAPAPDRRRLRGPGILTSVLGSLLTARRTGGFVLFYGFAIAGLALAIRSAIKLRRLAKARRQAEGK